MNQAHRVVLLNDSGEIVAWCDPAHYFTGSCPSTHATMGNDLLLAVERYISGRSLRVVWANMIYGNPVPKQEYDLWSDRKTDITFVFEALNQVVSDHDVFKNFGDDGELAKDAKHVLEHADFSAIPTETTLRTINLCLDYVIRRNQEKNLYEMCDDIPHLLIDDKEIRNICLSHAGHKLPTINYKTFRYIVNNTKKVFIDKADGDSEGSWHPYQLHPLPILTLERGGEWSSDHISVCSERPSDEYTEYQNPLFATELFSESIADAFVNRAGNQSR